jgi:hypothetical protein
MAAFIRLEDGRGLRGSSLSMGYHNHWSMNVRQGSTIYWMETYDAQSMQTLRTGYSADGSCENDRYRRNPQLGAQKFRRKNVGPTIQDSSLSQERGGPAPTPVVAPEGLTVRFCSNDCETPRSVRVRGIRTLSESLRDRRLTIIVPPASREIGPARPPWPMPHLSSPLRPG